MRVSQPTPVAIYRPTTQPFLFPDALELTATKSPQWFNLSELSCVLTLDACLTKSLDCSTKFPSLRTLDLFVQVLTDGTTNILQMGMLYLPESTREVRVILQPTCSDDDSSDNDLGHRINVFPQRIYTSVRSLRIDTMCPPGSQSSIGVNIDHDVFSMSPNIDTKWLKHGVSGLVWLASYSSGQHGCFIWSFEQHAQ